MSKTSSPIWIRLSAQDNGLSLQSATSHCIVDVQREIEMQNGEPNVYTGIANIRNGYMQMQWSRTQMYLVFNTVALPTVLGSTNSATKAILACAGLVVSTCIPIAVARGNQWMEYFSKKLSAMEILESGCPGDDTRIRVPVFSDPEFERIRGGKFASRKVFLPLAVFVDCIWLFQAAFCVWPYARAMVNVR